MSLRDKLMTELESLELDSNENAVTELVKCALDDIESRINDIVRNLRIESVSDLDQISEAYSIADKLSDDLY